MRIGFFGGSFDPPHLGHLAVGQAAAKAFSLDRVLYAPTGRQPLKPNGAFATFEDRLAMVSLLCQLQPQGLPPHLEASSIESPHADGSPNYTVETLLQLNSSVSPGDSLFVIIGADAFLDLPRWKSFGKLFELADWLVISRPNVSQQQMDDVQLSAQQRLHVHLLVDVEEPVSATEIRKLLQAGSDCPGLLPSAVLAYIRAHRLYGT